MLLEALIGGFGTLLVLAFVFGSLLAIIPLFMAVPAILTSFLLVYGLTNQFQDLWTEQIVKRGWTNWDIPNVLHPSLSAAWAAMIACGLVIYALFLRPRQRLIGRSS